MSQEKYSTVLPGDKTCCSVGKHFCTTQSNNNKRMWDECWVDNSLIAPRLPLILLFKLSYMEMCRVYYLWCIDSLLNVNFSWHRDDVNMYCTSAPLSNTASDLKGFKFSWRLQQSTLITQEVSPSHARVYDSLDLHAGSTYHIRAHLCSWPKYQFTLFIDIVYPSRQLLREAVRPGNGFVQQALTISCAIKK